MGFVISKLLFLVLFASISTEFNATEQEAGLEVTDNSVQSTALPVTVEGLHGCSWPDGFLSFYNYCYKLSTLGSKSETDFKHAKHGLLDSDLIDRLISDCSSNPLETCIKKIGKQKLQVFINRWKTSAGKFKRFESCLQRNTEAMNRMCGSDTELSRVVSGFAGLHLNILNIMVKISAENDNVSNVTAMCWNMVAEAVHVTTALYLKNNRYMKNSVLCWNIINMDCSTECSAYAKELACLEAACSNIGKLLKEFGIWQWYFFNSELVRKHCQINEDQCPTDLNSAHSTGDEKSGTGSSNLFDVQTLKQKFKVVQHQLEETFQLPFHVLLGIVLSIFVAFIASVTLLCLWVHGLLCCKGRSKSRYSRLLTGDHLRNFEEGKSLTTHDCDDIE